MLRVFENIPHPALLDDFAVFHHEHPAGHLRHHGEVVADKNGGAAPPGFQLIEEAEDGGLHGHIEGARRFVGDEQRGVAGQRHCYHHPLNLSAGKLVRVGPVNALWFGKFCFFKKGKHLLFCLLFAHTVMQPDGFGHLFTTAENGIQRGHRFLKNHGYFTAPDFLELPLR